MTGAKFGRHSPAALQLSGASQVELLPSPQGVPGGAWPALVQAPNPSQRSPSRQAPSPPPQGVSKASKLASQLPNPSQVSGASQSVESVDPQLVPTDANRSAGQAAESPSQTSAASQRLEASRQTVPPSSGVQMPSFPGRSHRAQPWLQATLQQKPSKQALASPQTDAAVAGVHATGPPTSPMVSTAESTSISAVLSMPASSAAVSAAAVSARPVSRVAPESWLSTDEIVSPPAQAASVKRSATARRKTGVTVMALLTSSVRRSGSLAATTKPYGFTLSKGLSNPPAAAPRLMRRLLNGRSKWKRTSRA